MDLAGDVIAAALDAIRTQQERIAKGDIINATSEDTAGVRHAHRVWVESKSSSTTQTNDEDIDMWQAHDAHPELAFDMLIADVLQQIMSDHAIALAWQMRDPQLHRLYAFGLCFTLRVLTARDASSTCVESVHRNCFVFLQLSVAFVARHLPSRVISTWRRTARKSGILRAVATALRRKTLSSLVKVEAMKCLTMLVHDSVVDCIEISRLFERSGINVFEGVVALALSQRDGIGIIASLEFITAASGSVGSTAQLAMQAIRSVSTFAAAVCSRVESDSNRSHLLAALFRCCRSVCLWHGPLEDDDQLRDFVVEEISDCAEEVDGETHIVEGALLLHFIVSKCKFPHQVPQFQREKFWCQLRTSFQASKDSSTRDDIVALCHRLLFNDNTRCEADSISSTVKLTEVIETLLECFRSGEPLGVALCKEWLARTRTNQSPIPRLLCTQLSDTSPLQDAHCIALVELLPTLLDMLERAQQLESIPMSAWCVWRDLAFRWCDDSDTRRRLCTLTSIQCLLRAKQARAMHEAVGTFRQVCTLWRNRYVCSENVSCDEAEVALGIEVLVGVSVALGFNLDQDAWMARSVSLWYGSVVSTGIQHKHSHSPVLFLVDSTAIVDAGHVNEIFLREILREDRGHGGIRLVAQLAIYSLLKPKQMNGDDARIVHRLVCALRHTPAASLTMGAQFQDVECDLVDRVAWAVHRFDLDDWSHIIASVCDVLNFLCVNATVAKRVFERRILHRWVSTVTYVTSHHTSPNSTNSECDRAFQKLTASLLRQECIRNHNLRVTGALLRPLILHIVTGIVEERLERDRFEPLQLELLSDLIQQDESALQELWRVCLLTSNMQCVAAQATILRTLTEPLRGATAPKDRWRTAFIAYGLSTSLRRATSLIQARERENAQENTAAAEVLPLDKLVTRTLCSSTGTLKQRTINLEPHDVRSPSSLVPVASDTAKWTLRLLRNCLRDNAFASSIQFEGDLFDQVIASLACPNADVSCAAAWVLRDAVLLQPTLKRIIEVYERPLQRSYRTLSYFAELRAHDEKFSFAPATVEAVALPGCFAAVESWIHFFAKTLENLQKSVETRRHLEAIQEIALYLLTQCFSQIYIPENDDDDSEIKMIRRAARIRHSKLCAALMHIACAPATDEMRRIRLLAFELLTALCSSEKAQFPVDFFCDAHQIHTLLALLETTTSTREQFAILHLIRELAGASAIKTLFGTASSTLLERLVKWLTNSEFAKLQTFATTVLRQLVIQAAGVIVEGDDTTNRKRALTHQQLQTQTLVAIATALLTCKNASQGSVQGIAGSGIGRALHTVTVAARLDDRFIKHDQASQAIRATVTVSFRFRVLSRTQKCLRQFRYRGKLRDDRLSVVHTIVLEADAGMLYCDILLTKFSREKTKSTLHQLLLPLFRSDRSETKTVSIDRIPVFLSAAYNKARTSRSTHDSRGILGRLLLAPNVPSRVVADTVAIVAELGMNQGVFCAPAVQLGHHIVVMMEETQRLQQRVDVTPLNSLTAWFSRNQNSVAHSRSSWDLLLQLIQRMRVLTVLEGPLTSSALTPNNTATDRPIFLTALMEWLATLECDSLAENCINVLFFENADVLLALAPLFFPNRSPQATFYFLISMAVRTNGLHCRAFAHTYAIEMMLTMIDGVNLPPSNEMLQHAARVVAKIARAGPAVADKFIKHQGMDLFGRIAFMVFDIEGDAAWDAARHTAADNLVLASSFLCEVAANGPKLPDATNSQKATLDRFTWHSGTERPRQLTLMEMLLMYLGVQTRRRSDHPTIHTSCERLAARVLRAWVEKWPGETSHFRTNLVVAVNMQSRAHAFGMNRASLVSCYATGFHRCIELTRWDYFSELHTVRVSYSATLSAGVRTGVIPLVCRTAFSAFDKSFLKDLREEAMLAQRIDASSKTGTHHDIVEELRDVLLFVNEQDVRVQTLANNRNRELISRVRVADRSALVSAAIHAVLAVVYDTFTDALIAASPSASTHPSMNPAEADRVVLAWLTVVEQICSLLCCALHELNPVYYGNVLRQMFELLVTDLPSNLQQMDRVMNRNEAVRMVLTNLERLLKQLMSMHELRGVTSEIEDVAQHAEAFLALYRQMKPLVSRAFALALSTHDAIERVQRCIVAAEYAWRRVLHDSLTGESITSFMAGTKESESLWAKIRSYSVAFVVVVRHPGPLIYARWQRLRSLLASLARLLDGSGTNISPTTKTSKSGWTKTEFDARAAEDRGDLDEDQITAERDALLAKAVGLEWHQLLVSPMPFVALESLLDHYGFASTEVKKQIALLNFPELRSRVTLAFARALNVDVAAVEELPARELERALTRLQTDGLREASATSLLQQQFADVTATVWPSKATRDGDRDSDCGNVGESVSERSAPQSRVRGLLTELQSLVDESDLGIHLRVVVQRPHMLSLWQLLLAPLRRARLFIAYRRMETWDEPNVDNRRSHDLFSRVMKKKLQEPKNHQGKPQAVSSPTSRNNKRRIAAAAAERQHDDPFVALASTAVSTIVNTPTDDPLSEESLVVAVKHALQERHHHELVHLPPWLAEMLLPVRLLASKWCSKQEHRVDRLNRMRRRLTLVLLLLTFWRQEELERDLTSATLARAFTTPDQRQDYFLYQHRSKALDELMRVWMPESGSLGLPLWHARAYFVGGSLLCVSMAWAAPMLPQNATVVPTSWARNSIMTSATYALVLIAFACAAASMYNIVKKHFVVQQRSRLRLTPVDKYYQNTLALVAIAVEVVQLNSISFDSQFNYSETDQIPKIIRWLGALGISQIGIAQVELKAALCATALIGWLVMLKCANKFQESNAVFNRLVTKDLPSVLHGTLYMGFLSTFFSFLTCVDCATTRAHGVDVKQCQNGADAVPFLLSHHAVPCWTAAHAPFALLGLWGVAFFLPIGLLAQGMNHVLFAHEALDVRFAPVVTLFAQLVKAITTAARAFFPFRTTLLASVALAGNVLLLVLMVSSVGGASRWYLRHVKSGIFAASGWAAACAIYRVQSDTARGVATTLAYLGWLAIGGATAICVRLELWRSDKEPLQEDDDEMDAMEAEDDRIERQQQLTVRNHDPVPDFDSDHDPLKAVELKLLRDASVALSLETRQTRALREKAIALVDDDPPNLRAFIQNAQLFADRGFLDSVSGSTAEAEAAFTVNAQKLAHKLDRSEWTATKTKDTTERLPGPTGRSKRLKTE